MQGVMNHKVSGKNALKVACPPMGNCTMKPGSKSHEKMEEKMEMKGMKMKGMKR